jgi:hypothetical protein
MEPEEDAPVDERRVYRVILEPERGRGRRTGLPAVITYGATREEALENARDAIRLYLGIPPQGQRSSRTAGRHPGRGSRYH